MPIPTSPSPLYREAAIEDMMGNPPGWLLHSGLTAIGIALLIVLSLTALIRYPEKVEAPFLLQTQTVPLALHAGAVNVIDTVFAVSGARVTTGDTLVVFRSGTNWRPLTTLDHWLREIEQDLYPTTPTSKVSSASDLLQGRGVGKGESAQYPLSIQTPFTNLRTILRAQASYRQTNGMAAEVLAFEREIGDAQRLRTSLTRQVQLYEKELGYQEKQADRMEGLEKDGVVSTQAAEEAIAQTISSQRQREVLVSSDIQNQIRVQQLRQQILQRRLIHREKLAEFDRQLLTQLKLLRTALNEYRDRYFLIARESGTLTWQPIVRSQATVDPTAPIGYLLATDGYETIVARLQLPTLGQGRISLDDRVILNFDAYPSREYGQVEGKLATLAPVALPDQNQEYLRLATVSLSDTLLTSYGKTLPFRYNLSGTARVITAERTLLARLLDQFLNLTQNS